MGKRYLIVKTSSLGDIVHCLPVVSYLKKIEPDCRIDWIAEKAGASFLSACSLLERVISIDTKKWRSNLFCAETWNEILETRRLIQTERYDMIFDLQGNAKSGIFTWLAKAGVKGGLGKNSVPETPNRLFTNKKVELSQNPVLNIREDYLWVVSHLLEADMPKEDLPPIPFKVSPAETQRVESLRGSYKHVILLAPGSAWENKRLSKEQLIKLLNQQSKTSHIFLAWGTDSELHLCNELKGLYEHVSVLPKLSLAALQLFMSKVDLVISVDSLALHLAATTGVPTLSFFGPSSAVKYAPKGKQHRHTQGVCPYDVTFAKRCPKLRCCPTGACTKNLEPTL